jgi:sigma-E factor negative regulatory protein RseC
VNVDRVGTVIEEKGDTAVVQMQRHLSCENCGRCGGILGNEDRRQLVVEVLNPIKAVAGQKVLVESEARRVIFISFMLYIVPLAGLVAGILLWLKLAEVLGLGGAPEPAAAGVGFALMALIFFAIRIWDRRASKSNKYKPVITALAEEEHQE